MEENVIPPVTPQVKTEEIKKEESKPTLDSIDAKLNNVIQENERIKKQNADKDAHISIIENENRDLRTMVEKVNASLQGKTQPQKDTIIDRNRQKLIEKGYDAEAVDSLLETMADIADQKAQAKMVPLVMEAAQDLIESDSEIDKDFLEKNSKEVTQEYNSYRSEFSPRKIKSNLKKAYKIVKERMAEKARGDVSQEEIRKRETMIAGSTVPPPGGKVDNDESKSFLDRIEKAGSPSGHFV